MKRTTIAVVLSLVLVALIAVPVLAAAKKLALAPIATLPGGRGFVVINSSSGPNNTELTVSLKGAAANTTYEVWLESLETKSQPAIPASMPWITNPVGTFTTNGQGNGNFHINLRIAPGTYDLGIDVAIEGADQYLTSNVYGDPIYTTFK